MLRPFYPRNRDREAKNQEVNVIVVPGIGTPPPVAWQDKSGRWLEKLVDGCSARVQIRVYEFKRGSGNTKGGTDIFQQLADEAQELLACLHTLCSGNKGDSPPTSRSPHRRKPLFFICHSLGGICLKWALSLTKGHVFRHLEVIEVISGIVFLGTPHLPLNIEPSPNILELIIRLNQRTSRKNELTSNDNESLAKCCHEFELLGIQAPIVSAYETIDSRVHQGIFKTYRAVIAPQQRSIVKSHNEIVVQANKDHNTICNVEIGSTLFEKISGTLQRAADNAPGLIYKKFHASTRNAGDFDTIRSLTTDNEAAQAFRLLAVPEQGLSKISPSIDSSKDATFGSSLHPSQGSEKAITSFEVVKRNPTLPCFFMTVHKRKSNFFGRADILDLIDENLLPENRMSDSLYQSSVRSYAICGMGGIGKTEIAVEYAYTRQSKYDAIFFVTADSKKKLSEEFAEIAVALGLEDQMEAKDLTVSCEIVKGWLSNPVRSYNSPPSASNEASWLLIFDNADDIDVLEDCWPTTGIGSVLITSRDSLAKDQIYTANHGIDLKPLSTHDAVSFLNILTRRFPSVGQEQDAAEVARKLGGLPLLLAQMAGVMTRLRLSYSEFLALYNASGIEDVSLTRNTTSTPEQVHSISSKIGLDGLAIKSLGLLCLISLLDPDRIPEAILINACADLSFDYFPSGLVQYYEARAQLLQTSLINQNPETKDIWIHRLVQDVAREKLGHKELIEIYNLAIKAVSSIWPFATLETRFTTARYKNCAPVFPSVVSLSNAYEFVSTLESFRPELASATLFGDAGWYRFERGFQEESKEWFKMVEGICDGQENKSSAEVAYMIRDTHHNLGTAAGETNDTKSFLNHTSIWLDMLKQRKTPEGESVIDYELCMGYNETGVAHAMDGQYQVAITYFSKAIESFQALPHYEDTMLGWSASNIGLVYWILGDYVQAEQALLEIIDIFKIANGVDDTLSFKTGKMLYALGNVYVSRGMFAEGFEYHTRCLKQYRATLGDSHHRIGDICHRLADDNLRFKNHAEARVLINQALKVFSGRQQYKQELARSTYKACQVSLAMGNKEKAEEELREAYTLRCSVVPDDNRDIDELKEADYDELVVFWSR